jgi:hypothetical protein
MKNYFEKTMNEGRKFESIIGGKHQKINSTCTPIGRADFKKSKIEEIEV